MTYLVILLLILGGIIKYDFHNSARSKYSYFYFLFFVLTFLSGFSYRLGGDIFQYMREFKNYSDINHLDWKYLNNYNGRLPGWVLLNTVCKSLLSSFWLFHLLHAFLLNFFVFKIIKQSTNFLFSGVLVYFVLLYFEFNFQIIRESLAIGFFLGALFYYSKNQWIKYYLMIAIAATIHETAIFMIFIPFVKFVKINMSSILFVFIGTIFLISYSDTVIETLLGLYIPDDYVEKVNYYALRIDVGSSFDKYSNYIINVAIPLLGLILIRREGVSLWYEHLILIYVLIYSMGLSNPILYRLNQFFILHFLIFFLEFFYIISFHIGKKIGLYIPVMYLFILIMFTSYRSRFYFTIKDTGHPNYVLFYPYASIIFQEKDEIREEAVRTSQY